MDATDIPEPDDVPIQRVRDYLSDLRDAILANRPVAGPGIEISEFEEKGTMISLDDLSQGGCGASAAPTEGTFVCGSVDGVKQWIPTDECPCDNNIDGGNA